MGLTAVFRAVLGRVPHRKNNRQLKSSGSLVGSGDDTGSSGSQGSSSSRGSSSQPVQLDALATSPAVGATSLVGLLKALLATVQTGGCQQSDLPIHFNQSLAAAKRNSMDVQKRKLKKRKLALKRLSGVSEDDEDDEDDDECAAAPDSLIAIEDKAADDSEVGVEEGDDDEEDDDEEAEDGEASEDKPVLNASKKPAAMPAPKIESDPITALLNANPKLVTQAAPKYQAKSKAKCQTMKKPATMTTVPAKDSCKGAKGAKGKHWEEITGKKGNKAIDHDKETWCRTSQENGLGKLDWAGECWTIFSTHHQSNMIFSCILLQGCDPQGWHAHPAWVFQVQAIGFGTPFQIGCSHFRPYTGYSRTH